MKLVVHLAIWSIMGISALIGYIVRARRNAAKEAAWRAKFLTELEEEAKNKPPAPPAAG